MAAGREVKEFGRPNDLIDRIAADPAFGLTKEQITAHLNPADYVGRAPEQVDAFLAECLEPRISDAGGAAADMELKV